MISVVLLGSGNVAYHLAAAIKKAEHVSLIQRYSRSGNNDQLFDKALPCTRDLQNLKEADVYVIAVNDEAVAEVSAQLTLHKGLVVHTSGSLSLNELHPDLRRGVLYPVQTFTIGNDLDFKKIPLLIEAETIKDVQILKDLAVELSEEVYEFNSSDREKLHISAVFANNFSNYMFICAESLCKEFNIPFDVLKPLILETANKVQRMDPLEAQTGPARRNEQAVMNRHLHDLKGEKKEIYKVLSKAIINTYR